MSSIELAKKQQVSGNLPEEEVSSQLPHVVIEPRRLLGRVNLIELWRYRELFYFLTWRDVKVRYKQTMLGAAWAILQPLFNMLLFTLIFGRLAKLPSDNIPYPLFALAGLLPWTFFANAVGAAGSSLVGNSHLVTKVYFPRLIIPASAVLAVLVDFAFAFGLMAVLMAIYRVPLTIHLLLLPCLILVTVAFAFAVGTWLAALQVKYRDVRYVIPFLIQFWMFATPIIYPTSMLPQQLRPLFALNPMAGMIEAYRVALLGGINHSTFDWVSLLLVSVITLAVLLYSAYSFRRMEKIFADVI
jgi:lipopolysaccharide transport system permease protein